MHLKKTLRGYHYWVLLLLVTTGYFCDAQILPEPGTRLNFTQIMFEHPRVVGADAYVIEVIADENGNTFEHPLVRHQDSATAAMLRVFDFGKKYAWRYTGLKEGKPTGWKGPYQFEIIEGGYVNKNFYRSKVTNNDSASNAGGLIIYDKARCIVDRAGDFVWFWPQDTANSLSNAKRDSANSLNRDLRITPAGTITLINALRNEEWDLNGHVLWQLPERITWEGESHYTKFNANHCFRKLESGNFMVLNRRNVVERVPGNGGKNEVNQTARGMIAYEVLQEFDRKGNMVWQWSSEGYFNDAELQKMIEGRPDSGLFMTTPGGHINAFDVDEQNGFVYISFRNVSRIIKLNKKTGEVVCSWGEHMTYNGAPNADGFFCKQHGAVLMRNGNIGVFDNRDPRAVATGGEPYSSVVIFTQPTAKSNSKVVWKYDFKQDNLSVRGGNVDELKNGNLLVCMGMINKVYEITPNKRIVWTAEIERRKDVNGNWFPFPVDRAHYTSSLYPCYFTIQTSCDTLTKAQRSFQLKVFNVGSDEDSYKVDISSASGNYKMQLTTASVAGFKSLNIPLSPGPIQEGKDKIAITVTSVTNPDMKRTVYIFDN